MPKKPKFAILMDGAFVIRRIEIKKTPKPAVASAQDVEQEVERIRAHQSLADYDLLRVYFYDASPASTVLTNPIDGSTLDLSNTRLNAQRTSLHQALELQPNFALRMGEAAVHGWTIGTQAMKELQAAPRAPSARDLVPNIEQKGVDLRIGLDIARLSLRALVDTIVVVTGDSDLIPAFKFARREGVRVILDHMGHGIKRELKVHADLVL